MRAKHRASLVGATRVHRGLLIGVVAAALAVLVAACGGDDDGGDSGGDGGYVLGVSNTVVGNGWREQMICSIQAEAAASGVVDEVIVSSKEGGAAEQTAEIRNLISSGADAVIVNPADAEGLDSVITQADQQGVVVVSVDQAVTAPEAYKVTNDQQEYGRIGAEWLFEQLGGEGRVVEFRGAEGAPADEARHAGFEEALAEYPGIEVVQEVFTGFQFTVAGEEAVKLLNSGTEIDGIWTSGQDYTVVNAFEAANKPYIPVVGADTNAFLKQLIDLEPEGFVGAAVTNPATIGGVGADVAIRVLEGEDVPLETILEPEVWTVADTKQQIEDQIDPQLDANVPTQLTVEGYTDYTPQELKDCEGPSA